MTQFGIVLALLATVVYNVGFVLEKRALTNLPPIDASHMWRLLRTLFTAPAWLLGFALILVGLVMQVLVLSLEPLTVAQPLQASGLVGTIVLSRLVLHERPGRSELACIAVLIISVVLLSVSSGRGAASGSGAGTGAAGLAVAAAAIPGLLAAVVIYATAHRAGHRRHRYPATGLSYSLCAGLMYGVAGLGLKALSAALFSAPHHPRGSALLSAATLSPYLYLVLACLAAGMCLFQTALQRSPVSVVVPVSTILSTGYLVIIGSLLFHERLPSSPVLLAMRLGGGLCAVTVPVILTIAAERGAARRRPVTGGATADAFSYPMERPVPMSLDPLLLNMLACPIDKQALLYLADESVLYNPRLRRLYHVRDDIPVMLADQGETVSDARHRDLLAITAAGGARPTLDVPLHEALRPHLPSLASSPGQPDQPGLIGDPALASRGGHAAYESTADSGEDAA
jgi:uncharacterized protein YbaR (Trm112 family)/drug/metabolite transporter (DMT)-like permease